VTISPPLSLRARWARSARGYDGDVALSFGGFGHHGAAWLMRGALPMWSCWPRRSGSGLAARSRAVDPDRRRIDLLACVGVDRPRPPATSHPTLPIWQVPLARCTAWAHWAARRCARWYLCARELVEKTDNGKAILLIWQRQITRAQRPCPLLHGQRRRFGGGSTARTPWQSRRSARLLHIPKGYQADHLPAAALRKRGAAFMALCARRGRCGSCPLRL